MGGKHSKEGYNVQQETYTKSNEVNQRAASNSPPAERASSSNSNPPDINNKSSTTASALSVVSSIESNTMETVVAKVTDLENGQMKEVEIGDKKVLLFKEEDKFFATGNKCTHYGAPLSKGSYCKGVVRCPWHGACFNIKTGDIEDFPGLDSIQTFKTEIRGQDVVVHASPETLANFKRVKPMVKRKGENSETVALIGGGPSTLVCAETLRQEGFTGRIVLISKESVLPYDRIKLSKALSVKPEEIALRKQEFYDDNGIELLLGKEVTSVAASEKTITLDDGQSLNFDKLVIGTGGQPRWLPIPGSNLKNVHVLRTTDDANAIAEDGKGKNVVIIGSSFIGLEVASFFVGKAASVNVICRSPVPMEVVFGPQVASWFRKLHESKGVKFHCETNVRELRGDEDMQLVEAELANGDILPADVCVMGVGVAPATGFLKDSGLEMTNRGFVTVNKKMQTNMDSVYAVGDIVEFPLFTEDDKQVNVQHWQMAHQHGRVAGLNIAGKSHDIHSVPYFWTVQYGKSVRYTGYGPGHDDIILHGDVNENKFVAYYTKADRVVAVASLGWDPIVSKAAELMSKGGSISKEEIKSNPESWLPRLCQV